MVPSTEVTFPSCSTSDTVRAPFSVPRRTSIPWPPPAFGVILNCGEEVAFRRIAARPPASVMVTRVPTMDPVPVCFSIRLERGGERQRAGRDIHQVKHALLRGFGTLRWWHSPVSPLIVPILLIRRGLGF